MTGFLLPIVVVVVVVVVVIVIVDGVLVVVVVDDVLILLWNECFMIWKWKMSDEPSFPALQWWYFEHNSFDFGNLIMGLVVLES